MRTLTGVAIDGAACVAGYSALAIRHMATDMSRKPVSTNIVKGADAYGSLCTPVQSLRASVRWGAGLTPTIDVWEDVTGAGGFDKTDAQGNKVCTTVKLNEVSRTPAAGGPVFYNSSVTFYIQDANYSL